MKKVLLEKQNVQIYKKGTKTIEWNHFNYNIFQELLHDNLRKREREREKIP